MKSLLVFILAATCVIGQTENVAPRYDAPLLWADSTRIDHFDTIIVNGNHFTGTIIGNENGNLYLRDGDGKKSPIRHTVIDKIIFGSGEELLGPSSDSTAFYSFLSSPSLIMDNPLPVINKQQVDLEANRHIDRIATTLERMFILQVVLIALGVISILAI